MNDYTWPSVYFAYFFFAICLGLAVYFCWRSRRDGYWSKEGEGIKYQLWDRPPGLSSSCCENDSAYYERHLPHWQPDGAALFLTWRLHGSLSRTVEVLEDQSAGKAFVALDREMDIAATGPQWLADERVAQCVVDALRYGERQLGLYELRAWVLMTNHVHLLIYPKAKLSRIAKAIKNFSAREANRILGRTGLPFWQDESYDHWVRNREELDRIVRYIEENPIAAGLVKGVGEWRWSSASEVSA